MSRAQTPDPQKLCGLKSGVTAHGHARPWRAGALTGASAGSSAPPSSAAPAAAGSRSSGTRRPSATARPRPGRTAPAAGTAGRARQGLPGAGSRQVGCLGHRQRTVPTVTGMLAAPVPQHVTLRASQRPRARHRLRFPLTDEKPRQRPAPRPHGLVDGAWAEA